MREYNGPVHEGPAFRLRQIGTVVDGVMALRAERGGQPWIRLLAHTAISIAMSPLNAVRPAQDAGFERMHRTTPFAIQRIHRHVAPMQHAAIVDLLAPKVLANLA